MNKNIFGFMIFIVGGTIGFVVSNKMMKQKYEQLVQDEIDSVKAAFRKEHPLPENKTPKSTEKERKAYAQHITKLGYSEEKKQVSKNEPHVIKPEEFGDMDDYDEISLTYYSDGTVTDDTDRSMSDDEIEEAIGKDSLKHFGEYEDDSVFVRNDNFKVDYEILSDPRSYKEILKEKPYLKH